MMVVVVVVMMMIMRRLEELKKARSGSWTVGMDGAHQDIRWAWGYDPAESEVGLLVAAASGRGLRHRGDVGGRGRSQRVATIDWSRRRWDAATKTTKRIMEGGTIASWQDVVQQWIDGRAHEVQDSCSKICHIFM